MAVQQYNVPQDYKSGLADLLKESKNIYEAKKAAGYQQFPGPQIAGFAPEELASMAGIAGLVGAGQQYFTPATQLTAGLTERFTPDTAQQYMSPYQQAVIDVQKREAVRQSQRPRQDIAAAAVQQGGYGGSREAILEAERQRNLQQQLGDIQTRGSQAAFETGLRAFESQKARERQAASGLQSLGQAAPRQRLAELTALAGIGEAQRGMTQQGLDLAYQQFQQQQQYPYELLGQYQSTLYGYPYQAYGQYQPPQTTRPSASQNLAGVLGAIGKVGGSGGFGFFNTGGRIAYKSEGGLSGMIKELAEGSTVGSAEEEEVTIPTDSASLANMLREYMTSQSKATELLRESQQQQEELAKQKLSKMEKQASPINYLSDVLLGYAAADPESGIGAQLGEAVSYAEEQKPDIESAKIELQQAILEGKISIGQAEQAAKKLGIELGIEIADLESPDLNLPSTVSLLSIAEDMLPQGTLVDFKGPEITKAVTTSLSEAAEIIKDNPKLYKDKASQEQLTITILQDKLLGNSEKDNDNNNSTAMEQRAKTTGVSLSKTADDVINATGAN